MGTVRKTGETFVPIRTCAGCGRKTEKGNLIRIARTDDGRVFTDPECKGNGRGAYLCRKRSCLELACKRKSLHRTLRTVVPEEVLEELQKEMDRFEAG